MKISKIMTKTVISVGPDKTLLEIDELMDRMKFEHVLVMEHQTLLGVISRKDINRSRNAGAGTKNSTTQDDITLKTKAFQIMTRQAFAISEESSVVEALEVLITHHIHFLPVKNKEGHIVGVVTSTDFFKLLISLFKHFE